MRPADLPARGIDQALQDAFRRHQVVVIEGPTGSGKTTQIPQMLRDSGMIDPDLVIAVTQPRRIAAISVAHRIAQERGVELGTEVGYAIRFDDVTSNATRIKVMTDGLLLQEVRTDRDFSRYGVVMVDEAHERSLNIDFTLGLLRDALDRRADLRVVISSATINTAVFSRFFQNAPVLTIDAKPFPVAIRWDPLREEGSYGRVDEIADVICEIHSRSEAGDILVFLTGEGEIKSTMTALEHRHLRKACVLPLYGRLTREEQEHVFDRFEGKRKIVLATNIAETSLTIDGIRYVVDLGLAKIPYFDSRTGIPSLREQPVSQASARQRAGRAGRTAPGVCIRLYERRDFHQRDAFHKEEVLRMDLSEVALRLIDLGIHDVETFHFVTRPPRRSLKDAIRWLQEMGAIDSERRLTDIGRRMVPFPLPPRLSRMIVACADQCPDVLHEVLTVGGLLSVRWPQVMPPGEEDEARAAHRRFGHPLGDLIGGIAMTEAYEKARDREDFCHVNYLDPRLMGEVLLVREQLRGIAGSVGVQGGRGGEPRDVVRSVATGFTRNICRRYRSGGQYETATGVRVAIHPGSCARSRAPQFFVAADIIVTRRAWARAVCVLEAEDVVLLDPELARRWQVKTRRSGRKNEKRSRRFPETVELFGRERKVRMKRGKPLIELEWARLKEHAETGLDGVAPELAAFRVSVGHGPDRFLNGLALGHALAVAPHLRIDEGELTGWPEGEVYEAERELFRILRVIPELLRVVRSRRRGRAAFLTLITNGAGGYWFDAARNLELAVEQSHLALAALLREPVLGEADRDLIEPIEAQVNAAQDALTLRLP